jgi:hypothetical protein
VFVLPESRAHMKTVGGDVPCSKRYKGLLLHGAREMKLDPAYITKLEEMPEAPLPKLSEVRDLLLSAAAASAEQISGAGMLCNCAGAY